MDEDSQLVARAQRGDKAAFDALMTQHYGKVFGQALRMMKSSEEAKDVTQTAWIKAWSRIADFRGDAAFTTWMYRITTYAALDAIRKRNSRRESLLDSEALEIAASAPSSVAPPSQLRALERSEIRERFAEALEELPEPQRTALSLREIDGLSYEEIAAQMECKIGTVMSRLFNARKALQKHLADLIA